MGEGERGKEGGREREERVCVSVCGEEESKWQVKVLRGREY